MAPMAPRLAWARNPLAYPAGVPPAIDYSHPMATKLRFAAVPTRTNFMCLQDGRPLVATNGTPVAGIDANFGPGVTFGTAVQDNLTYAGSPLATDSLALTMAAFYRRISTDAGSNYVVANSQASSGVVLAVNVGGVHQLHFTVRGGGSIASGITIAVGVPYFLAWSQSGTGGGAAVINFVVLNLLSGVLTTAAVTNTLGAAGAPSTGPMIGNNFTAVTNSASGMVGPVAIAGTYLGMETLVQCAADPFSLWYANRKYSVFGASAAAGAFSAYWANNNNQVIGTGVY